MLYGLPKTVNASGHDEDLEKKSGLGAVVPHSANAYYSSGGGFVVQGIGGGSPPPGTQSTGITVGSTFKPRAYHPIGLVTSPAIAFGSRSFLRSKYQESKQGSRVEEAAEEARGPGSPNTGHFDSWLGSSGLGDLGAGFNPFSGKWWKQATTVPRPVKIGFTKFGRVTETAAVGGGAGALTGFVASGFNPIGALIGAIGGTAYGIGKGIKSVVSNTPQGRALYQTAAPAAVIGAAAGGAYYGWNAWGAVPATPSPTAGAPISIPGVNMTPAATYTGPVNILSTGAPMTPVNPIFVGTGGGYITPGMAAESIASTGGAGVSSVVSPAAVGIQAVMPGVSPAAIASGAQVVTPATTGPGLFSRIASILPSGQTILKGGEIALGIAQVLAKPQQPGPWASGYVPPVSYGEISPTGTGTPFPGGGGGGSGGGGDTTPPEAPGQGPNYTPWLIGAGVLTAYYFLYKGSGRKETPAYTY